jgi:mannose-6-phosphate isomerase-like protein (cupin superfamily)
VNLFDFGAESGFEISGFGSRGATAVPLTLPDGEAHVVVIRLVAGGVLGRHPASVDQVFAVVDGSGWVCGPDGERAPVAAGTAVYWSAGDEHESGTDDGLTAIVVEAERIRPRLP